MAKMQTEKRLVADDSGSEEYLLTRKQVKNINLRITADGSITVSANPRVSVTVIDGFVKEKLPFIRRAKERLSIRNESEQEQKEQAKVMTLREFEKICIETWKLFTPWKLPYPVIKFRNMKSIWGSCHTTKGTIVFNSELLKKPRPFVEYVVLHEFAHFLVPNHSKDFYTVIERFMPDYKQRKKL